MDTKRSSDDPEQRPIQISVRSDAATETLGWGGTYQREGLTPLRTRGYFTEKEQALHINALELLGYTVNPLCSPQIGVATYPH